MVILFITHRQTRYTQLEVSQKIIAPKSVYKNVFKFWNTRNQSFFMNLNFFFYWSSYQWPSGISLQTGWTKSAGFNPRGTYRPSRSEFSVVFLRYSRKYGLGSYRKAPMASTLRRRIRSLIKTIGVNPTTNQSSFDHETR